ncbi:MAG: NADH-quinone oxidoreductase subunit NuoE [Methylohalobius crimeensis]
MPRESLTPDEIAAIRKLAAAYPRPEAAAVDALHLVQDRTGWIDDALLEAVAEVLGLSLAYLDGLATFYPLIHRRPVGKKVIRYCDSVSCWLMGGEEIAEALRRRLGIGDGETTPDGAFTLLPHPCLGGCHEAPAALVNHQLYTRLDPGNLDRLLEDDHDG